MGRNNQQLPSIWEIFTVIGILGGLIALIFPAVKSAGQHGPFGELIPNAAPDEADRISDANGISIVLPKNWELDRRLPEESALCVFARCGFRRRRSFITIQKTERPSNADLTTTTQVTFQGFPAHERMAVDRESTFDDPAYSSYVMYVDTGSEWWRISWVVAKSMRRLPPALKRYIDTIRLPVTDG